jgi:Type II secretion system (T2SS), protein G
MKNYWLPIGAGLLVVLGAGAFFWHFVVNGIAGGGYTSWDRAKGDVRNIEAALLTYQTNNKSLPDNLEKLTEPQPNGGTALLEKEALIDPWSRPYQYDPKQLHPTTEIPRVWSDGPDPGNPDKKIANWH